MIRRFPVVIAWTILVLRLSASASMAADGQIGQVAEQLRTALAGDPVEVTQKFDSPRLKGFNMNQKLFFAFLNFFYPDLLSHVLKS